jgi:hypothetical protein
MSSFIFLYFVVKRYEAFKKEKKIYTMRSLIATRYVFSRGYFNASTRSFALVPFKLADIGEGIAEVELMKWFVKVFRFKPVVVYLR